jgi:kinesin family protein 5
MKRKEAEIDVMRKTMTTQLNDFASMKKKLMRDLQNRCEKVVELEITLDENKVNKKVLIDRKS